MGEYSSVAGPVAGVAPAEAAAVPLTPRAQHYLEQTRPWVRFMSIVTFCGATLILLTGIAVGLGVMFGGFGSEAGAPAILGSAIGGSLLALFYMAVAVVYVVPGVYLARYASAIGLLKTSLSASVLEDAIRQQKSFWRFIGILTAIGLLLAVVGIILVLFVGAIAATMAARS